MTLVASIRFCSCVSCKAWRMAAPKSVFMGGSLLMKSLRRSADAIGERRLELFAGVEGAEHSDGFDRGAGKFRRDVVVDGGEPDTSIFTRPPSAFTASSSWRPKLLRPSSRVCRTIDCLTASVCEATGRGSLCG